MGVEPTQDLIGPDTVLKTVEAAGPLPSPLVRLRELTRTVSCVQAAGADLDETKAKVGMAIEDAAENDLR
jgi:hypothetical protein